MAPTTVSCEYTECSWKSQEGDLNTVVKLLEMHFSAKHRSPVTSSSQTSKSSAAKPEKAKRPELAAEVSDEDWNYFLARWEAYKKATCLEGEDLVLQLMECCCEGLRRDHHRTYPSISSLATESSCLAQLKQLAVRAKNRAVHRVKLNTLKQDKGEPVRKFAGRIRSLAGVSDYSVKCTKCDTAVPYTDSVIMDQVIAGLAELDIQRDVLSHPDAKHLTLEKLLIFIEGKESGQASLGLVSGNSGESLQLNQRRGHPGQLKRGITKKKKIVGQPTHDKVKSSEIMTMLIMTLLTGSAILSSLPSSQGEISSAQVAEVSQGKLVIGHHVYCEGKGWLKQATRSKPMVGLNSKLDMSAYKALGLKPPAKQANISVGQHLADTGASICLGGKSYLRSLGLTEDDLTPCDMYAVQIIAISESLEHS